MRNSKLFTVLIFMFAFAISMAAQTQANEIRIVGIRDIPKLVPPNQIVADYPMWLLDDIAPSPFAQRYLAGVAGIRDPEDVSKLFVLKLENKVLAIKQKAKVSNQLVLACANAIANGGEEVDCLEAMGHYLSAVINDVNVEIKLSASVPKELIGQDQVPVPTALDAALLRKGLGLSSDENDWVLQRALFAVLNSPGRMKLQLESRKR